MEAVSNVRGWLQEQVNRVRAFARRQPAQSEWRRPRVGLALGGGFARGVAHIGVLKVLKENNIPVDCIAGTSVGALIAAAYACGTSYEAMEKKAQATRFKDFGRWTLSWLGLASNEPLENYLQQVCTATRFEELKLPLAIAATDLGSGEAVYFSGGDLGPPLRASCAYPGLFLPVQHEGRILVDGFLVSPVPVEAVRQLGAELVIAVWLESISENVKPKNMMDMIGRSFAIMQRHALKSWRPQADVVIEPDVAGFLWDEFQKTPQLIAAGEDAARAALPKILAALQPPAPTAEPSAELPSSSTAAD